MTVRFCSFTHGFESHYGHKKNEMNIKEAQDRLYGELKQNDDVVGISNNGELITVMLLDWSVGVFIPTEYEGYEVVTEVTGPIHLQ